MALQPMVSIRVEGDNLLDDVITKLERIHRLASNIPTLNFGGTGAGGAGANRGAGSAGTIGASYDRQVSAAEKLARQWHVMREQSTAVVRNVIEIAKRFASITGLMGALSGLATGFGFLGFNALARSVTSQRMQQLTAGAPDYGGFTAARGAFGTYGNVNQLLTSIANARGDPSKGVALQQLFKFSGDPGANASPVDLMARIMTGAARLYTSLPAQGRGALWSSFGLEGLGITQEMARAWAGLQPGEIEKQRQIGQKYAPGLQVDQDTLRKYQEFTSVVDLSRQAIENTFVRGLVKLAPALENLLMALQHAIERLTTGEMGEKLRHWIDQLATWIEEFSTKLARGDYDKQIDYFGHKIGEAVDALGKFITFLNNIKWPKWLDPFGQNPDTVINPFNQREPNKEPGKNGEWRYWHGIPYWHETPDEPSGKPSAHPPAEPPGPPPPVTIPPPPKQQEAISPLSGFGTIAYHPGGGNYGSMRAIPVMPWPLPLPVQIMAFGGPNVGTGTGREGLPGTMNAAFTTGGGGGPVPQAGPQSAAWGDRAKWFMGHMMKDLGMKDFQAAGFASNIASESGFLASATGPGGDFGIEQLMGDRQKNFFKWADAHGFNRRDPEAQVKWLEMELLSPAYRKYLNAILQSGSAEEAQRRSFGFESGESPGLEKHRGDHGRFVQQLEGIVRSMMRGMQNRDPGLHEPTSRGGGMEARNWRPMTAPVVTVRNETGGSIATSSHLMAV